MLINRQLPIYNNRLSTHRLSTHDYPHIDYPHIDYPHRLSIPAKPHPVIFNCH